MSRGGTSAVGVSEALIARMRAMEARLAHLESLEYIARAAAANDADTVDTYHAGAAAAANILLALNAAAKFPTLPVAGAAVLDSTLDVALTSILRGNVSLYSGADLLIYDGAPGNLKFDVDGATGNVTLADGATIGQAAGPLIAFDDTNNYLEITGCNVGIGTTGPISRFHIVGSGAPRTILENSDGAVDQKRWSWYAGTTALVATALNDAYSDETIWLQVNRGASLAISSIALPTGNVGIGTTAPLHRLAIGGDMALLGGGDLLVYSDNPGTALKFDVDGATGMFTSASRGNVNSLYVGGYTPGTSGEGGWLYYSAAADTLQIYSYNYTTPAYGTVSIQDLVGITNTTLTIGTAGVGNLWVGNNCSALSFTDRTPWFNEDALDAIRNIRGGAQGIDHASLPLAVQVEGGRNLSAMVSLLTVATQQLLGRVEKLEKGSVE